jgi:Exocyst complex component Sec5
VRDYKKGKSLMQTSFKAEVDEKSKRNKKSDKDSTLPANYKGVFEKVWHEVERIAAEFREELFHQLASMTNPIDTQEKIIGYLVDLDAKRDPMSVYLEKQYLFLIHKLIDLHNNHINTINGLLDHYRSMPNLGSNNQMIYSNEMLKGSQGLGRAPRNQWVVQFPNLRASDQWSLTDLVNAISTVSSTEFEDHYGDEINAVYWKLIDKCLSELCEIISVNVLAFWKSCKLYIEGRLQSNKNQDPTKRASAAQMMLRNLAELVHVINVSIVPIVEGENNEYGSTSSLRNGQSVDSMAYEKEEGSYEQVNRENNDTEDTELITYSLMQTFQ